MCGNKDNYKHMPELYCFPSHLEKIPYSVFVAGWDFFIMLVIDLKTTQFGENQLILLWGWILGKPRLNFNSLTKGTYYIGVLQNCHSNTDIFCIVTRRSIHCECLLLIQSNHIEVRFSCIVISNKYLLFFDFLPKLSN